MLTRAPMSIGDVQPMSEDLVTILRDRAGNPQHVVLEWQRFEALRRAAETQGSPLRRLGREVAGEVPTEVSSAIDEGTHPVRAWREFRGSNQARLASATGISRAYLAQIESSERTGTLEVMARLAGALGCLIEDLIRPAQTEAFAARIAPLDIIAAELRRAIDAIPTSRHRNRPAAGGFSLLEQICHLRDIDQDGYARRLALMLAEERPSFPDLDGERLAAERDYQSQEIEPALAAFAATRAAILQRLGKLSRAERSRTGLMNGEREMSVDDLVGAMLAHDAEHREELAVLAAEFADPSARD